MWCRSKAIPSISSPTESCAPSAARLLRERSARRHVGRFARFVRHLFWHEWRASLRVGGCRKQLERHRARFSGCGFLGGSDAAMIRVILPAHLRTLARVNGEVSVEISGEPTLVSVLNALETQYPVLRGTIRDQVTHERRPFVRFFACEEDYSHEPAETALPSAVVAGKEPFLIVGAMSGG